MLLLIITVRMRFNEDNSGYLSYIRMDVSDETMNIKWK